MLLVACGGGETGDRAEPIVHPTGSDEVIFSIEFTDTWTPEQQLLTFRYVNDTRV